MEATINTSVKRVGNFTSSEIAALMTNGKERGSLGAPAKTYIQECNFERRLGRSLTTEINSHPVTWGQLVETRVFELLGLEYKLVSKETIVHPEFEYWAGSPDGIRFKDGMVDAVIDIKCPITLKSFCQLVEPLYPNSKDQVDDEIDGDTAINFIRDTHKDGEKYYWQLVSNSILTNAKYAELIVYCPFSHELKDIQELASNLDSLKQYRYKWIAFADTDELPSLPKGKTEYNNLNVIRFEIPQSDKQALIERVKMCGEMLINL